MLCIVVGCGWLLLLVVVGRSCWSLLFVDVCYCRFLVMFAGVCGLLSVAVRLLFVVYCVLSGVRCCCSLLRVGSSLVVVVWCCC